jgi:uncharacterized protein (TIGR03663 family)
MARIREQWPAIAILIVAAAARLTLLGMKPPHFDEGVNGWFVDQMTHTGFYHYDPTNYHGPFHFYVLFIAQTLLGRHIWALRLPLALMSLAAVGLTIRFDRFIGRGAALWAAAAMAISPGCVFYGRYAIHEYWLVFSLMLCAWGLAGLWKWGERRYLWAVWIGVTGAVLTKETYVIHFAACALTLPCVWVLGKATPAAEPGPAPPQEWTWRDMGICAAIFVGCVAFFYSGGFMDLPGLKGLYQCFGAWAQTGKVGNGHEKPWYYWLKLCGRYEWPSCVGLLVAALTVLPRTPRFIRALAIYGVGTLVAYSIIHYKTPWCIVSLTWPFLLLFGYGVDLAIRKNGTPVGVLAATVLAANLCDMVALNYFHFTDAKEPYVYVQTFEDVNDLMNPLNTLVARNPANYQMTGYILMESYHPLPWLLGDYPNIGYYDNDTKTPTPDADFLMVDESRIDDVENTLRDSYFTKMLTLRDAEDPAKLYLSVKKFQSVFPGRKPDFVPAKEAPAVAPEKAGSPPAPAGRASQ